jgi:TonB family protein
MPRDARFWRNVTLIAVAHIAIVVWLVRWNDETRKPNSQSIVWVSGAGLETASKEAPAQTESSLKPPPAPEGDLRSQREERDEAPALTPAKSDIQLPTVEPSPTPVMTPAPRPSMTPSPKPSPKPTVKPSPKPSPKKIAQAKATPKPSPKKSATPSAHEKKGDETRKEAVKVAPAETDDAGEKSGSTGPGGDVQASEFSWYGKMLHDRFYSEWIQPTTSVAIGAKMSAMVKIRIEKDGGVSKFTVVKPSGNVVVDESVAAVAARVTQVDPLPKGLGSGAYFEVNINFELKPEQ